MNDEILLEQFYKRDENVVLFHLYDILCRNSHREMVYSEICSQYNDQFASSKKRCAQQSVKLTTLDIAHYSKKLEKIGFVISTCNSNTSEKKIRLRKADQLQKSQTSFTLDLNYVIPNPERDRDELQVVQPIAGKASRRKAEAEVIVLPVTMVKLESPIDNISYQEQMRQVAIKR